MYALHDPSRIAAPTKLALADAQNSSTFVLDAPGGIGFMSTDEGSFGVVGCGVLDTPVWDEGHTCSSCRPSVAAPIGAGLLGLFGLLCLAPGTVLPAGCGALMGF